MEDQNDILNESTNQVKLLKLLYLNKTTEIVNLLQQSHNLDIISIRDKNTNDTLLHKVSQSSQVQLLKIFIHQAQTYLKNTEKNQISFEFKFKDWINQANLEGYTALHFASLKGNLEIIEILDQNNADYDLKNHQGWNVLHIAASTDQIRSLGFFLLKKNMDLHSRDSKQSTPVHWASFLGHEQAINFFCSLKNLKINETDSQGLTPLHLACVSGNGRVVRKLLLRGADKNIEDKQGKKPIHIAQQNEFTIITQMLETNSSLMEYCNIRPTFTPVKNKKKQLITFIFLYLFGIANFLIFNLPFYILGGSGDPNNNFWMIYILGGVIILMIIFFFISWLKEPGYIQKFDISKNPSYFINLVKNNFPQNICFDCNIVKPARSRHCEICQYCISVYDHHCPWINNCVGTRNHKYFFFFILFIWLNIMICIIYQSLNIYIDKYPQKTADSQFQINFFNDSVTSNDNFRYIRIAAGCAQLLLCLFFQVPLTILGWVQINNFLFNKTTFERFNQHKNQHKQTTSSIMSQSENDLEVPNIQQSGLGNRKNSKDERKLQNCFKMCCDNQKNSEYSYLQNSTFSQE